MKRDLAGHTVSTLLLILLLLGEPGCRKPSSCCDSSPAGARRPKEARGSGGGSGKTAGIEVEGGRQKPGEVGGAALLPRAISVSSNPLKSCRCPEAGPAVINCIGTRQMHQDDTISVLAFSPDGRQAASTSYLLHPYIYLWDTSSGALLRRFDRVDLGAKQLLFGPRGRLLFFVGDVNPYHPPPHLAIQVFDAKRGVRLFELGARKTPYQAVTVSSDGRLLAAVAGRYGKKAIEIWDLKRRALVSSFPTDSSSTAFLKTLAFSRDGKTLEGYLGGVSATWSVATGKVKVKRSSVEATLLNTHLSRNGLRCLSSELGGSTMKTASIRMKVYDGRSYKLLAELPVIRGRSLRFAAFSPDGKLLAFATHLAPLQRMHMFSRYPDDIRYGAVLWDIGRNQELFRMPDARLKDKTAVSLAPDWPNEEARLGFSSGSKKLAVYGWDNAVRIWDVGSARMILPACGGHTGEIASFDMSFDGRLLITSAHDGTVRFWDTRSGREMLDLRQSRVSLATVRLAFGGKRVAILRSRTHRDPAGIAILPLLGKKLGKAVQIPLKSKEKDTLEQDYLVSFLDKGEEVAVMEPDQRVRIWKLKGPSLRLTLDAGSWLRKGAGKGPRFACMVGSAVGRTMALADQNGGLWVVDTRRGRLVPISALKLTGKKGALKLALTPDGSRLAAASAAEAAVMDLKRRKVLLKVNTAFPMAALVLTPDGKGLIGTDGKGRLHLWREAKGSVPFTRVQAVLKGLSPSLLGISGSGRVLAASQAHRLWLIDPALLWPGMK